MEKQNIYKPETYVKGFPHEYFAYLRRENPIFHWDEHPTWERGFWNVTRFEDTQQVSRNWEDYKSSPHPFLEETRGSENEGTMPGLLISLDPPDHNKMRKLVNKGFTPKRVEDLTVRIQEHVDRIIDSVADGTSCDMVSDVAVELPLQVIADLVGVPTEDRHQIFEWTEITFGFDQAHSQEERRDAMMQMYMYAEGMCEIRKNEKHDDLIGLLMEAEVDNHALTQQEIDVFFMLLQNAGSETTRNLLTTGTMALLNNPDQMELLKKNPSLIPSAVEEMLRLAAPVMQFKRTAVRDTMVGSQKIEEGEVVVMWYPSANRDEAEFKNSNKLDVGRNPNNHVSFGAGGPHFCLGASLARLEARLMFESILARFEDLEAMTPEAELPRVYSNLIDGYMEMPITWSDVKDRDATKAFLANAS